MSAFPEIRYRCDCCLIEVSMPVQNTPMHTRTAGPEGWTALTIGVDPGTRLTHLCEVCSVRFKEFLNGGDP